MRVLVSTLGMFMLGIEYESVTRAPSTGRPDRVRPSVTTWERDTRFEVIRTPTE